MINFSCNYFYSKMLELVDSNNLIIDNYYYVKSEKEDRDIKFLEYDIFEAIKFAVCLYKNNIIYLYTHNTYGVNYYYKYISKKEFYKKLKEKYDAKCLDIVLKRLVDESFVW